MQAGDLRKPVSQVACAYFAQNRVEAEDIPALLRIIASGFTEASGLDPLAAAPSANRWPLPTPAQVRSSVQPDALISFEDGKPYKVLTRHLKALGLTFEEYRDKWCLPPDYPSVAASVRERRSQLAKASGLGTKTGRRKQKVAAAQEPAAQPDIAQ